jgi:hypothetical protein
VLFVKLLQGLFFFDARAREMSRKLDGRTVYVDKEEKQDSLTTSIRRVSVSPQKPKTT